MAPSLHKCPSYLYANRDRIRASTATETRYEMGKMRSRQTSLWHLQLGGIHEGSCPQESPKDAAPHAGVFDGVKGLNIETGWDFPSAVCFGKPFLFQGTNRQRRPCTREGTSARPSRTVLWQLGS